MQTINSPLGLASSGSILAAGGSLVVNGPFNANGFPLTIAGSGNVSIAGDMANVVGLTDNSSGTTTLGNVALTASQTLTSSNAGHTLTIGGTLNVNGFPLTIAGAGNVNVSGSVTNLDGLTDNSSGTTTLSNVTLAASQTFTSSNAGHTLTVNGSLNNNGYALAIAGSGSVSLAGSISGSGAITLSQNGFSLLLGGNNSGFSGGITASTGAKLGTITVSNNNVLGSGTLTMGYGSGATADGATPQFLNVGTGTTPLTIPTQLVFHAVNITGNRPVTFTGPWCGVSGDAIYVTNSATTTFAGSWTPLNPGDALRFDSSYGPTRPSMSTSCSAASTTPRTRGSALATIRLSMAALRSRGPCRRNTITPSETTTLRRVASEHLYGEY